MIAFEMAGEIWDEYLSGNMTVNIHVEMTNLLPENVIGGALPAIENDVKYSSFRDALENDIDTWGDAQAFDGLPLIHEKGQEKFQARVNLGAEAFVEDSNDLDMTTANAKALGLINPHNTDLDGYVLMNDLSNSSLTWNYDTSNTSSNQINFFSVAAHEIGHLLGFISGVDKSDGLSFSSKTSLWNHFGSSKQLHKYLNKNIDRANPMDLFRYSLDTPTLDNNTIDMSLGENAFFSRDGKTVNWNFSKGKQDGAFGSGYQASHWEYNSIESRVSGIMDPVIQAGSARQVSNRDLMVMDTIGYDISNAGKSKVLWQANEKNGWLYSNQYNSFKASLEWQAKRNLAKEIAHWADAHDLNRWIQQGRQAHSMTQNRREDVEEMIRESEVYEAARGNRRTRYRMEAYFSEFSWQELTPVSANSEQIFFIDNNANEHTLKDKNFFAENTSDNSLLETELLNKVQNTNLKLVSYRQDLVIPDQESNLAKVSEIAADLVAS